MAKIKIPGSLIIGDELTSTTFASSLIEDNKSTINSYQVKSSLRSNVEFIDQRFNVGDIVYYEFTDGSSLFLSYEEAQKLSVEAKASLKGSRAEGLEGFADAMFLPTEVHDINSDRGLFGSLIAKIISIVTKGTVDKIIEGVGADAMKKIASTLENKLVPIEGLYCLDKQLNNFNELKIIDAKKTVLLFIHGTNSNTKNAFGGLIAYGKDDVWRSMFAKYGTNILALEHHTLTKSALDNTLLMVKQLPERIELCVITHSRGGLVLDTLQMCLECQNNSELRNNVLNFLKASKRENESKNFEDIMKELKKKNIVIKQTIKVASPSFGTTLLSENAVNLVRVITLLAKNSLANPIITYAEKLIVSMLQTKDNINVLPGLEIMTPDSPFLKLINSVERTVPIEQFVLAGRSSLSLNIWHSLKFIGTYLVIQDRSDMVVNTESMHQGVKLLSGYKYFLVKDSTVFHSSYFVESSTQKLIKLAIDSDGKKINGTEFVSTYGTPAVRGIFGVEYGKVFENTISGTKPIVILIPGIMGSTLSIDDERYWLHYGRFIKGGLLKLDINNNDLKADGLVMTSYEKFVSYLKGKEHDVYTHPYDWRKSVDDSVSDFEICLRSIMAKSKNQPIRIVSHSMGGLLVRALAIKSPDLYKNLSSQSNFRWIMLGTPWLGSFRAIETIVGRSRNIKMLDKIAFFNSIKSLLEVFSKFPGVLELLPLNTNNDLKEKDVTIDIFWNDLYRKDNNKDNWVLPEKALLDNLKIYKQAVSTFTIPDAEKVFYIAGRSPKNDTPQDYEIVEGEIIFKPTEEGDGTVTWQEGIPKDVKDVGNVYYINVSHGQLVNDKRYFPGIFSIINSGTSYFSKDANNITRGGKAKKKVNPIYKKGNVYTNNVFELEQQLFDFEETEEEINLENLEVSISHGDLKYANGPLMIGHFRGEYIAKAEYILDLALDGALSARFRNKAYPGELGTSLFILRDKIKKPSGALIVGLGDQFELTAFRLSNTVCDAIIHAFHQFKEDSCKNYQTFPDTISTLLIGSAYGNLSIETSMKSILEGVQQANEKIVKNSDGLCIENTIKKVEFVEIYGDKAYSAFYALKQFHDNGFVNLEKMEIVSKPGAMKILSIDYGSDKWNQLTIRGQKKCPLATEGCKNNATSLVFNLNVGIAKEESKEVYINKLQIDHFLFELIKEKDALKIWDKKISKVLFERLIPQNFKTNIRMQNNLVLNLDKDSASYPWELIQDTAINVKPICVSAGMIRQLSNKSCNTKKMYADNNSVLIIGDPLLNSVNYNQLSGAVIEATQVAKIFGSNQYDLNTQINSNANELLMALYADPHRYIHVAAHGDFNPNDSLKSGVVIGCIKSGETEEYTFLTAADILQLDPMPEFVFINTCYSGKNSANASDLSYKTYEFAANIGEQFIAEGVKAIIIAGWPVYDDMALLFAEKFYTSMFRGYTFGDAVQKAREACFKAAPDKNTWGAYQCYGDPMYQFNNVSKNNQKQYLLPQEVLYDLDNINSQADNAKVMGKNLSDRLTLVSHAINELNCKDADILERQAMAYYKLGKNDEANDIFEELFTLEKANFSLKSLEQIYNVKAKILVEKALASKEYQVGLNELQDVIKKLSSLLAIGSTSERLSLIGSTYKRLAYIKKMIEMSEDKAEGKKTAKNKPSVEKTSEIQASKIKSEGIEIENEMSSLEFLERAIKFYDDANKVQKSYYPYYNKLVLLQFDAIVDNAVSPELSDLRNKLESDSFKDDYYDKINWFNLYTTEYLYIGKCTDQSGNVISEENIKQFICNEFESVWNDYGTFHHLRSEYEHLENLIVFLKDSDVKKITLQKVIDHIRNIEANHKSL